MTARISPVVLDAPVVGTRVGGCARPWATCLCWMYHLGNRDHAVAPPCSLLLRYTQRTLLSSDTRIRVYPGMMRLARGATGVRRQLEHPPHFPTFSRPTPRVLCAVRATSASRRPPRAPTWVGIFKMTLSYGRANRRPCAPDPPHFLPSAPRAAFCRLVVEVRYAMCSAAMP